MLLLDRQSGATVQPHGEANRTTVSPGRIQLRIRADGLVFDLPSGKTTIGSSPRCNVRLERPGVQPLHCLIVESPGGLRVRSWVANTALNGAPFEESALAVGDCLSLGPIELDVIDPLATKSQPEAVDISVAVSSDAAIVRAGRNQARTRSRRLLQTLRNERTAHEELCRQVAKLQESHLDSIAEQNEISGKLENCLAELAAARHQLIDYQSVEIARQQLAKRNEELGFEIGELSAQINELTQGKMSTANERQQIVADHAALEEEHQELIESHNRLQSEFGEVARKKEAVEGQNWQLVEELNELRDGNESLRAQIARLDEDNATLAAAKATLAEEQARLVAEQNRLLELEREIGATAADRENTSDELYRALLQISEMEERDRQNKAVIEAYESLSKEHNHLHSEADQLREQVQRLSEERANAERAWQALSAEAATLGESQQRMVEENATLVARLDEARQQLEKVQQEQVTAANSTADVESERAAKLQAEANLAAAIAEGQRRLAEQERRFAEQAQQFAEQSSNFNEQSRQQAEQTREFAARIEELERQLAAAGETRDSLARAREEAQLQLAEAESHREEQARRIQELELQLAAAEERAAKAAELAANQPAAEQTESASHVASGQPAEFHWSSARSESASHDELNVRGMEDVISGDSLDVSAIGEAAWDCPANVADAWRSVGAETAGGDAAAERSADTWLNAAVSGAASEEPNPWIEKVSPRVPIDASSFGEDDANGASLWNQAAAEPGIAFGERDLAEPEELVQEETRPENGSAAKREPVSFIERYSHLFAEDSATSEEKPAPSNESAQERPIAPVVAQPAEDILNPKKSEEEDSIEQYMAKLLQRVRGESEGGKAAREQPSRMPLNAPRERLTEHSEPPVMAAQESHAAGQANAINDPAVISGEMIKRRVSSPAPATNLGALRALANETARLAISRHELRKLRRNAVTKTIVATLAGMTSLWLMLDSPDWRNVQFLTACGALLVAAYWAAEAFRTLLNSMRIKPYEGPEEKALPIDVETRE
jgi:hypothetical protein